MLRGVVASVVFRNQDNGYSVIKLDSEDSGAEAHTVVGCLPDVSPGETVELVGEWTAHHSYGQQFRADSFTRAAPEGAEAILRYLSSGVIRGIGPGRAREIVAKFGENALEILETAPEKLAQVRGITRASAREFSRDFKRKAGVRRLIDALGEYGVPALVAMRVYGVFGDDALEQLAQNPYLMTDSAFGAEFYEADRMASAIGFEQDCPERLEAALVFELRHNLNNGHVFIPTDKLAAATAQLVSVGTEELFDALDILSDDGEIIREEIAGVDACYLREMREAEVFVAARLLHLALGDDANSDAESDAITQEDAAALVTEIESALGVTYAEGQLMAVRAAATGRIMALTGGPGTGKTTSVRGILELFDRLSLKTLLCAPTGRAAKRMGELAGRGDAMTVHRALGARMDSRGGLTFEHSAVNPLRVDAVIVDEASMLDLPLTRALLEAMRPDCRLILVGDMNQLPSVGPGNVLSDIIKSDAVPVVRLTEIFRQAQQSAIVRAAHAVNGGELPDISEKDSDMFFLKRKTPAAIADTVAELMSHRLPENMGVPAPQIQALSPSRRGEAGTAALNIRLQQALNPPSERREKAFGSFVFREGDRVMQIRNDYDIMWTDARGVPGSGVYNGDLGVIVRIDLSAELMTVEFDDKIVEYMFEQLVDLEPAYAVTVHKSQGSEYRAVILALPPGSSRLATRAVLYTAITRARELLIIVGDTDVLQAMTENDRRQRRYSGLKARLTRGIAS
ncbi:MAG: ATP-dependent RecD-like DNA helicase [Oscillospiraceae bacterium]|jgi:exodeoxyribonuclease V alpha subunit|nr:ATP-dependent RecD-like DNA helicase [Oscillospiraceae bacterium]